MKTKTVNIPSISIERLTQLAAEDVILPPNQEFDRVNVNFEKKQITLGVSSWNQGVTQ